MNLQLQLLIDQAEDSIRNLERCRLVNTIAGHNHVVIGPGDFAIDFDFDSNGNGTKTATRANMTPLWKAPQFTKKDAQILADACECVGGRSARAMFINDAVDLMVGLQRTLIERLHAMAANQATAEA